MPTRKFSLKQGEPARLELTWRGIWKDIRVLVDGREIGEIPDGKALKAGRDFTLPEGLGTLRVQLVQSFGSAELQVLRNGQPLPGSGSDPEVRFKGAWGIILFIAGFNFLIGLGTVVFEIELFERLGLGVGSLIVGVVYLGLGLLVKQLRSRIALGLAIALFALDGIATLVMSMDGGGTPPVGGIIVRVFLLLPMIKGFEAIKQLEEAQRLQGAAAKFE